MPTPANRAKIQLARGNYSNIAASLSDLVDGELCYAKDQNKLYMVEGTTLTPIEVDIEQVEDAIAGIIVGGTAITATQDDSANTLTISLDNTAVTAATYGSSTAIPQITIDAQGRITAATTATISTDMTVAADSGNNETISIGTDTFTIAGGTALTSTTSTDTVTVALDDTAVTPATYGSATAIPSLTIDQQGRITAATENTINNDVVLIEVHNQSGSDIAKGKPVYVSGTHSSGKATIELADNDGSGTYPAIGLVYDTITTGTEGYVIISGLLTNIPTSTLGSAGDPLYIDSTPGDLTTTRPTAATEKVQKVGLITRSHATNGTILIIGAGRTNDVNNEIIALTGVALNASDLGTFTGSTITDNSSIKTALQELETAAETQFTTTDGNFTVTGDLTVQGTTTTVDSTTLLVEDKNIELGNVATPTDTTADGGGITLKGATDKTINWVDSTDAWTFSEHINIADTKEYRMNGTAVLAYSGSDKILDNVIVDGGTY